MTDGADLRALSIVFADLTDRHRIRSAELEGWNVKESSVIRGWQLEGKLEGARENLLELLQGKFGEPLPSDLRTAIESCTELETLKHWFRQAISAADTRGLPGRGGESQTGTQGQEMTPPCPPRCRRDRRAVS